MTIERNTTLFGKSAGYKATLNGRAVCTAKTKTEAKSIAQDELEQSYAAAHAPMVFRKAADGSVFVARWISADQAEYYIVRGSNYPCVAIVSVDGSLQRYMDRVVADYNRACA